MKLETLEFIHGILVEKIDKRDFSGDIKKYEQTLSACIELKEVIETAAKRSNSLRILAYKQKTRLPILVPFNIEVEVL